MTEATNQAGKLPLISRIMALNWKLLDRLRHRSAFEVAKRPPTGLSFDALGGAHQCLVVTYKRSGEPVPSPVNTAITDGTLYFRSEPHVGKVTRLGHTSRVLVCACNFRGKPRGPVVEGRARVLSEDESAPAAEILASSWTLPTRVVERGFDRLGVPAVYVEVTASPVRD